MAWHLTRELFQFSSRCDSTSGWLLEVRNFNSQFARREGRVDIFVKKEDETKRKPNGNFHCEYFLLASLTTGCLFCSRSFRYNIKKKFSKNDNYLKYFWRSVVVVNFFNIFLMITVSLNFCPVNLLYRVFRMEQIYNMLIIKI